MEIGPAPEKKLRKEIGDGRNKKSKINEFSDNLNKFKVPGEPIGCTYFVVIGIAVRSTGDAAEAPTLYFKRRQ